MIAHTVYICNQCVSNEQDHPCILVVSSMFKCDTPNACIYKIGDCKWEKLCDGNDVTADKIRAFFVAQAL